MNNPKDGDDDEKTPEQKPKKEVKRLREGLTPGKKLDKPLPELETQTINARLKTIIEKTPIVEFDGRTLTDLRDAEMRTVDKTIYFGWTQQKIDFEYLPVPSLYANTLVSKKSSSES